MNAAKWATGPEIVQIFIRKKKIVVSPAKNRDTWPGIALKNL